jgi:aminopeptidase YwaD
MAALFRRAGLSVSVQRFPVPGRGRSRNVIGAYDGPRSCLHVVMAHTDTAPGAPGANDNASGLGVLAALAGRLGRYPKRCDVWLAATGAEERIYTGSPDHLGALAMARRVRAGPYARRLGWALSLDEVGRDRPFWLRSPRPAPRPGVEGALLRAARRVGADVRWVRDESSGNSDHREFELLRLPALKLGVGAGGEPCRHSPCDRPGRLDPVSLRLARRIVEAALGLRAQALNLVEQRLDRGLAGRGCHDRHAQPALAVDLGGAEMEAALRE